MDTDMIGKDLNDMLAILNGEEYPEAYAYIAGIVGGESWEDFDAYKAANELLNCDRPGDFPQYMIDLITGLFQICIDQGNADAMNDLGAQYYDGARGFEQDFEKAVCLYTMAAEYGSRQAQENLGYCYYYGRTGAVDYEKAFRYFALGAFDGRVNSLYKIGDMYASGYYVEKDQKEAFGIYARCLDIMTEDDAPRCAGPVYLRIAKMLLNGYGCEADARAALVCYQKAETFLYDMVKDGDVMYRKSWQAAIDGQSRAREKLRYGLDGGIWPDGKTD